MLRVFKVIVMLVVLPLCLAFSVQPAYAVSGNVPVYFQGAGDPTSDPGPLESNGGPEDDGEGDPDEVGGGYGAAASDSDQDGLFGGLMGTNHDGMTFEEFIYFMMLKFMPTP